MSKEKEIDLSEFKDPVVINNINYYRSREIALHLGHLQDRGFFNVIERTIKFYFKKSRGDWFTDFIDDRIIINQDFIYFRCRVACGEYTTWKYDYLLSANGFNLCSKFSNKVKYTIKGISSDVVSSDINPVVIRFNNLTDVIRKNSDGTEYISARDLGELLGYYNFSKYIPTLQYALDIWKSLKTNNSQQHILIGSQGNDKYTTLDTRDFDDLEENIIQINPDVKRTREKVSRGDSGGYQYKYDYHMSIDFTFHLLSYSDRTKPKFQELMGQLNNYRRKLEEQNEQLRAKLKFEKAFDQFVAETSAPKQITYRQEWRNNTRDKNCVLGSIFVKIIQTFIDVKNILFNSNLAKSEYIRKFVATCFNNFYLGFYDKTKEQMCRYRGIPPNKMGNYKGVNFLDYVDGEELAVIYAIRNKFLVTIEPALNNINYIEKISQEAITRMIYELSREFRYLYTVTNILTGEKTYPEKRWQCSKEEITPTKREYTVKNN